ncbi:MAG: recombination regulator RecX [Pelistega sp.]|nr:recombination regulator RecX [Pelistega sp.]
MTKSSFESSGRAPRADGLDCSGSGSQCMDIAYDEQDEDFSSRQFSSDLSQSRSQSFYESHSPYQSEGVKLSSVTDIPMKTVKPVNLLAKAVALLSRREYSEQELRRKLTKYTEDTAQIDTVIARLQKENWQSDERFAENFVLFRQQRWGNLKILQALRQHHLSAETVATLKENLQATELERAVEVWERKFHGQYPTSPQEKAKQMRFLASRGFSADVVYKVISRAREE